MLSGNTIDESVSKTLKRMENQLNYFEQTRNEDVFNIFVNSIASVVLLDPVPAITGTLLFTVLMHSSTIFLCSWWLRVGDSPVVPQGTNPCEPSEIDQSIIFSYDEKSTFSFLKGVINAGILPLNIFIKWRREWDSNPRKELLPSAI